MIVDRPSAGTHTHTLPHRLEQALERPKKKEATVVDGRRNLQLDAAVDVRDPISAVDAVDNWSVDIPRPGPAMP